MKMSDSCIHDKTYSRPADNRHYILPIAALFARGECVSQKIKGLGIKEVITAPASPRQKA